MKCCLCFAYSDLRNSHIIPEFVYRALYDSKHRFHVLSTNSNPPRPMEQKGLRERLLCDSCEQQLSVYENYARKVLLGGTEITVLDQEGILKVFNLNYPNFKLFQLSVLWRSSVSRHEMFSRVRLGPHEEKIRKMLAVADPGGQLDYPCIMFGLTRNSNAIGQFIDQPRKIRIEGHNTYRFIFSGFMWSFYISSHKLPSLLTNVSISEAGEMAIGRGPLEELTELGDFAEKLKSMGRMNVPTE